MPRTLVYVFLFLAGFVSHFLATDARKDLLLAEKEKELATARYEALQEHDFRTGEWVAQCLVHVPDSSKRICSAETIKTRAGYAKPLCFDANGKEFIVEGYDDNHNLVAKYQVPNQRKRAGPFGDFLDDVNDKDYIDYRSYRPKP